MKAILDTNAFVSYLLKKDTNSIISCVIEAGFKNLYTLLLPDDLIIELNKKLIDKPYLSKRIKREKAEKFIKALYLIAEKLSPITSELPKVCRDPKDDYLLAYALVGEADYLVTGDKDLLVLKHIGKLHIVSLLEFFEIIKQ